MTDKTREPVAPAEAESPSRIYDFPPTYTEPEATAWVAGYRAARADGFTSPPTDAGTRAMQQIAHVCDKWGDTNIPRLIREVEEASYQQGRADREKVAHKAAQIGFTYGALGRDFEYVYRNVNEMLDLE